LAHSVSGDSGLAGNRQFARALGVSSPYENVTGVAHVPEAARAVRVLRVQHGLSLCRRLGAVLDALPEARQLLFGVVDRVEVPPV